jgi:anhydro-N-acetylmuramic acid kinase
LLEKLNGLAFFKKAPPKSLGIEWVHDSVLPLIEDAKLKHIDVLATFTHHIAIQLRRQFKDKSTVFITGGGALNTYLIELLRENTSVQYVLPGIQLIEYKEALIFAILGVLKLEGKVNTLASVTGAKQDHSAGKIYLP